MKKFSVQPDIRKASTLPTDFYTSDAVFEECTEKIFTKSWLYLADALTVAQSGQYQPINLLPQLLDEPLLISRDHNGKLHCLSNVCTHRGKIIAETAGKGRMLSCGYHGRCFRLDGSFKSMPGFEQTEDFPTAKDDLPSLPIHNWHGMLFSSLDPAVPFRQWIAKVDQRIGWLPLDTLEYHAETSADYHVDAHWALYCDNFLEGFHIPFVHPALNDALEVDQYETETFEYGVLQIGIAEEGQTCFDPPPGHQDHGRRIYAYYYWLFPNIMLNFYPWGISVNLIQGRTKSSTDVLFRSYKFKDTPYEITDSQIDQTEIEDEAVVLSVQRGIRSRLYHQGRFSATHEKGVHHFHRLIAQALE
ncbi:MAG: aromatic ring-hydroxylating dioxygenase subunit alpha [Bacteroidota bacterium]